MSKIASTMAGHKQSTGPSYSFVTSYEENFDADKAIQWLRDNLHIPFIATGVYLAVLYFGQKLMAKREPFKAKTALAIWNTLLAVFSIVGFCRTFPELLYTFNKFGFEHTICNNTLRTVKVAAFWSTAFQLSKIPELVDTLFLVLRKQKLIFLHVYHHATVLLYAWFAWANALGASRWFCVMNFGVHSIMYTYYALKAFPNVIQIPKWVSMVITTLQTVQMVAGAYVIVSAARVQMSGRECAATTPMTIFGLIIYISYLILFSHFFYKAYCSPAPQRSRDARKKV